MLYEGRGQLKARKGLGYIMCGDPLCYRKKTTQPSKSSFNALMEEKETTRDGQIYIDMESKQH